MAINLTSYAGIVVATKRASKLKSPHLILHLLIHVAFESGHVVLIDISHSPDRVQAELRIVSHDQIFIAKHDHFLRPIHVPDIA